MDARLSHSFGEAGLKELSLPVVEVDTAFVVDQFAEFYELLLREFHVKQSLKSLLNAIFLTMNRQNAAGELTFFDYTYNDILPRDR